MFYLRRRKVLWFQFVWWRSLKFWYILDAVIGDGISKKKKERISEMINCLVGKDGNGVLHNAAGRGYAEICEYLSRNSMLMSIRCLGQVRSHFFFFSDFKVCEFSTSANQQSFVLKQFCSIISMLIFFF